MFQLSNTTCRKSVVIGLAFGDEGKGTAVQWLCKKAARHGRTPIVARFGGGAQAAHTIVQDGVRHICSTYGGGVLLGTPTALFKDVFFDPVCAYNEYLRLKELGVEPKLLIDDRCRVVTPYDVAAGRVNARVLRDGTCGKGIYQTFRRHNDAGFGFPYGNWGGIGDYLKQVANYYGCERDLEAERVFTESYKKLPHDGLSKSHFAGVGEIVFEGSQGLLLDMEHGYWPNVTPSNTGLKNLLGYARDGEPLDVWLVTRTYLTRHGNGWFPNIGLGYDLAGKLETNVRNDYQGEFRTSVLNFDVIFDAVGRHCLDNWKKRHRVNFNLLVTHGDVSLQNGYIAYILGGREYRATVGDTGDIKGLFAYAFSKLKDPLVQSIFVSCGEDGNFV